MFVVTLIRTARNAALRGLGALLDVCGQPTPAFHLGRIDFASSYDMWNVGERKPVIETTT